MAAYEIVKNGAHVVSVPDFMPDRTEADSPIPDDTIYVGGTFQPDDAKYMKRDAGEIVVMALQMDAARTTLQKIHDATELGEGDSLDDLRSYAGDFADQLGPLSEALMAIGSALLIYGQGIEEMIPRAKNLSSRLPELWTAVWNANQERDAALEKYADTYGPYDPESEAGKAISGSQTALDNAVAKWEAKAQKVDVLWNSWVDLHDSTTAAVDNGLDDLEWDDVINGISDKIHDIASFIAKWAGIGAIAPIPVVQEVLGGIALTAGGVALYISVDHALDGTGTWGDVINDGIDVLPITDLPLLTKVAKVPGLADELIRAGGMGLDIDDAAIRGLLRKWQREFGDDLQRMLDEGITNDRLKDSLYAYLENRGKGVAQSGVPEPEYPKVDDVEDLRRRAERIARRQAG